MLQIKHLKKSYHDFSLNCSLTVKPGHITGLLGLNGAGKSTTFKAILGLIEKDNGSITIFNQDNSKFDKEKIGVVLSDSGFSDYLTLQDIIPILHSFYRYFDRSYFMEKCLAFHLPMNKKIKTFSSGMKAKLKVLIAMSHQASLLILDEPTAGLDVIARDEVLDMLRDFMEEDEQHSILISSHISSDLENLCDDFYMIHEGAIIMHEDTDKLLSDYAFLKVDEKQYHQLDKQYLLRVKKESYGYLCLTNERQYYLDNYPNIVIERSNIDELISIMIRGEKA